MANTIQIKRRSGISGAPTLADGELGFDTSANALYIGKSGSNVLTGLPTTGGTLTGLLKINTQGIITTIGSQNANWVHIYNNGEKPFIFNNTVATTSGDLGTSSYQFNNAYIKGTLTLSKTQDASGTANNSPALIIGGIATGQHIEIDGNEILAKTDGTTPGTLYLQDSSGEVRIAGTGGLTVSQASIVITKGNLWSGTDGDTANGERQVGVRNGAGSLFLYSVASSTGNRGLYVHAHGTGSAKNIIVVDTNNNATFAGTANKATQDGDGNTISSTYLKKSGGSMSGWVWHSAEVGDIYDTARYASDGGGWSYAPIRFRSSALDKVFFGIGAYGTNNALNYAYIGPSISYSDVNNMRIYPSGAVVMGNGGLQIGNGTNTSEISCKVSGKAGLIYMYSASSTTGNRGIYLSTGAGTRAAKYVMYNDSNNENHFYGLIDQIYYGSSAPTARTGQVWLKPI